MRTCVVCLVLSLAVFEGVSPPPVGAQELALTEAQALDRLAAESPAIRALRARLAGADAGVLDARRLPNPVVTVSRESVAGVAEDFVLVSQPLTFFWRRGPELDVARARAQVVAADVNALERRARADLRLAFAELMTAQARQRDLQASLARVRELARALAAREEAGDAAGFDRLRAEQEAVELAADLEDAAAARAMAQAALAAFFAPPVEPATLRAVLTPQAPVPLPELEALIDRARASLGELAAFDARIAAARFARAAADRRWVPDLNVVAGVKTSNAGTGDRGGVLSVLASLPLFDRGQPERARAAADERLALAERDAFLVWLRAAVEARLEVVARRRAAQAAYDVVAAQGAADLERIARVSYDAGERTILEVIDAYRAGVRARLRGGELAAAVRRAEIELEYLTGWEGRR